MKLKIVEKKIFLCYNNFYIYLTLSKNKMKAVITVTGKDTTGIIAKVSAK